MTTDTKTVARWNVQDVPKEMKHIRCAKYPDLLDYHYGVSGKGPHAYAWEDKPHRLVYDLTAELAALRDEITGHEASISELHSNHERVVSELCRTMFAMNDKHFSDFNKLGELLKHRDRELAASRAEVDGLDVKAARYDWIRMNAVLDGANWDQFDAEIDAAMEKGNV